MNSSKASWPAWQEDGSGKERLPGRRRSAWLKAGASSTISERSSKPRANRSNAADGEAQSWQERLAGLSQLKKQLDRQQGGARELSRGELKAFVDKLEQDVTGELDRRALAGERRSV